MNNEKDPCVYILASKPLENIKSVDAASADARQQLEWAPAFAGVTERGAAFVVRS